MGYSNYDLLSQQIPFFLTMDSSLANEIHQNYRPNTMRGIVMESSYDQKKPAWPRMKTKIQLPYFIFQNQILAKCYQSKHNYGSKPWEAT